MLCCIHYCTQNVLDIYDIYFAIVTVQIAVVGLICLKNLGHYCMKVLSKP